MTQNITKADAYPYEIIELPSKGSVYPKESPFASGEAKIKFMTAKEEDILLSQNLLNQGKTLEALLKSIVLEGNAEELVAGDRNAIYVASRIMAYGSAYDVSIICRECGDVNQIEYDLSSATHLEFDSDSDEFKLELPKSKKIVTYKILSYKDEKDIEKEVEAWKKINKNGADPYHSTRYKYMITSVDGEVDKRKIKQFVDKDLLMMDSRALRQDYAKNSPNVDLGYNFECKNCGNVDRVEIPIGGNFFWPADEL